MVIEKSLPHQDPMIKFLLTIFSIFFYTSLYPTDFDTFSNIVRKMKTVKGDFQQVVLDSKGDTIQEVSGEFYFKKPNMFRWNYKEPFKNEIISDGDLLYLFDPDLRQVIVSSLRKLGGVSPAMLIVSEKAREFFIIDQLENKESKLFKAIPKNLDKTNFKSVLIKFKKNILKEMQVIDNFNHTTTIKFNNIKNNMDINNAFFLFNTPDNVDVIKN